MADNIIDPQFEQAAALFFQKLGANVASENFDETHTFGGNDKVGKYALKNSVGKILDHVLPNVKGSGIQNLKAKNNNWDEFGQLFKFEQSEFLNKDDMHISNFFDYGFVFIPKKCNQGQGCNIHVHIHGCDESLSDQIYSINKLNWVTESTSDYLKYAISNDLIILYP